MVLIIYVRDLGQSAKNVEKFYLDNRSTIESLETITDAVFSRPPINTSEISVSTEEEVPAAEFNFINEVFEAFPVRPLR